MTPRTIRTMREAFGWSQSDLATLLRMGAAGRRTVERWEAGGTIPGPARVALAALAAGWRESAAAA